MAVEVAQHLQNKFLTSLVEAKSELSGSVNLLSYFEAIKDILEETEEISSSQMVPIGAVESSPLLYHLSQLNYALVECRNAANKLKELNKKLLLFNKPFMVYFILRMKRRLTTLKENFRKHYIHVKPLRVRRWEWERMWECVRERMREWEWKMGRGRGMERMREWEWEMEMGRERERQWEREWKSESERERLSARGREWARARELELELEWEWARELELEQKWEWEWEREREREWKWEREREVDWARTWVRERDWARTWARKWARKWASEEFGVHVFGFDEQAKKIESMLFGSEAGIGFSAIGIVGIAGAGKTTLVRKVLTHTRVRHEFSPIILLCVSNIIKEEYTRAVSIRIVTSILQQLGCDYDATDRDDEGIRLGKLLKTLDQVLRGKKYLIVLDDVWHMNDFYSDLAGGVEDDNTITGDRLSHGLPKDSGGAVIVTTTKTRVARGMVGDQNNLILVEQLDRETLWRIFMDSIPNQDLKESTGKTLEKIKNEILDRSLGLPLVAKMLAEIIPQRIRLIQYSD